MNYARHIIQIGEMASAYRILVVKFLGEKQVWKLDVGWRIVLT
jgi:hypothetical protein